MRHRYPWIEIKGEHKVTIATPNDINATIMAILLKRSLAMSAPMELAVARMSLYVESLSSKSLKLSFAVFLSFLSKSTSKFADLSPLERSSGNSVSLRSSRPFHFLQVGSHSMEAS